MLEHVVILKPLKILNLEASYGSGLGINPRHDCGQTEVSYAHQIAAVLCAYFTVASYSDAIADSLTKSQVYHRPQSKFLAGDHDIALIAIGSNNIQLVQSAIFCTAARTCAAGRRSTDRKVPVWEDKIKNFYSYIRSIQRHDKIFGISFGKPLPTSLLAFSRAPWNYSYPILGTEFF